MLGMILSALGVRSGTAAGAWCAITAVLCGLLALQSARLTHAKADLSAARLEATDLRTKASVCLLDRTRLQSAVTAQNAALEARRAESERRAAQLAADLSDAQETAAQADRKARALQAYQNTGSDVCTRLLNVDRAITGR